MPRRLEIGPHIIPRPGYELLDIRPLPGIDHVADARFLPFGDGLFDEIVASNVLEHFYWHETRNVLWEWRRVLKLGGVLDLLVPNFLGIISQHTKGNIPFHEMIERVYGSQNYPENTHYTGFSFNSLSDNLVNAGFTIIHIVELNDDAIHVRCTK